MPRTVVIAPVVMRFTTVTGAAAFDAETEAFDYACGKARAEAIDVLILHVVEERGWSLFDDGVVKRVRVEHDGETRARILVDGAPATRWWQDRVVREGALASWTFEPTPADV